MAWFCFCANGEATNAGVITYGGWVGKAAAHHITLRNITLAKSLTSHTPTGVSSDHGIYISQALGGVHDCLIDGLTVYGRVIGEGSGGLDSAIHFYHSSSGNPNATNFTIRNVNITGTDQAIIVWDGTVQNILVEDTIITNATNVAVRYEQGGTLTLRRVTSTGSGSGKGFYSSLGTNPPGVTFDNSSLY